MQVLPFPLGLGITIRLRLLGQAGHKAQRHFRTFSVYDRLITGFSDSRAQSVHEAPGQIGVIIL